MNQPRIGTALIIFISSYSPLGVILAIKDYDFAIYQFHNPKVALSIFIASIISVLVLLITIGQIRHGQGVSVKRISNRSNELVNYTIPYMISFFGFDLGKWQEMVSFGIFMALMFVVTIRTQSLFINPILAIIGYGLFDVDFDDHGNTKQGIFISKITLKSNQSYLIESLSDLVYFVTKDLTPSAEEEKENEHLSQQTKETQVAEIIKGRF